MFNKLLGKCGENYHCGCSEQCQLSEFGYYCITRPPCQYLEDPQWVCASDGQTYSSECSMLANNACSNETVYLVRRGKCFASVQKDTTSKYLG